MRRLPLLLALGSLLAPPAFADAIPVGGRVVRGTWWEDGDQVVVNPYNSTNRAMTFGVERHPKARVAIDKIKPTETPEEEYCRRAFAIRAGKANEDHAALAKWCEEKKRKELAEREWEAVLEGEPANEAAKKALGASALKEVLRRNGKANPALGALYADYLAAENPATRHVLLDRMKKEHDCAYPIAYLERARRSGKRPKGRTDDVPLTLRSKEVKGKRGVLYTMFVPANYDPMRATPLLIGLHGGGAGGKDGTEVTGSGPAAMNFYTGIAEERGWLVACPTALRAMWHNEANEPFLEAMMDELFLLYNVDVNRVYLTGHSMGGFGSWHWGSKWAERWAAVGPMAGGGCPGAGRFKDTQTPVYLFHGTDDNVCAVGDDRGAAEQMLKGGNDFVYTELNGVGHGCPPEVLQEMAAFFEVKRLAVGKGRSFRRSDEIRSSFLEKHPAKLLREEIAYLGDPEPPDPRAAAISPEEARKALLKEIDLGGGAAKEAATKFGVSKDVDAVKPLSARLGAVGGKIGNDVRAACATALGGIGSPEALPALQRALSDESDEVFVASVDALMALADRGSGPAMLKALDLQAKRFDDKRMGEGMSYNDYEIRCGVLQATVRGVAALSDPVEAVTRLRDQVVKRVLEAKLKVPKLERADMYPERVRAALGVEVAKALGRLAHPSAAEVLKQIRAAFPGESSVESACDEALAPAAPTPTPSGG
ncbi:MAG TPA: HEAT repeat domain-containing protein [Planctomycetota bacterium]|nr:HEAT repeat domain-containing protein [Planctomycetota bacterium]